MVQCSNGTCVLQGHVPVMLSSQLSQRFLQMCHKERHAKTLTFGARIMLPAQTILTEKLLLFWMEVEVTKVTQCLLKKDFPKPWYLVKESCFLAPTTFKSGPTSSLTGSRGHRGSASIFGERITFLALTVFKWEGTSCLTRSRGHRNHTVFHEERLF